MPTSIIGVSFLGLSIALFVYVSESDESHSNPQNYSQNNRATLEEPTAQAPEFEMPLETSAQGDSSTIMISNQPSLNQAPQTPTTPGTEIEANRPNLARNWNLEDSGLYEEDIAPFLTDPLYPPQSIHYRESRDETKVIRQKKVTGLAPSRVLFLSSEKAATQTAQSRLQRARGRQSRYENTNTNPTTPRKYNVVSFKPGWRDNGEEKVAPPPSLSFAVQGPDFTLRYEDDSREIARLRNRTVTLGHGGEIVLQAVDWVVDGPGLDFAVFENPFRYGRGLIYQEFAQVGVAEVNSPDQYHYYPCNPREQRVEACAGVVPTDEGGDRFDLGAIGLAQIKFIKIKDIGYNFVNHGSDTEGFDLDALSLIHTLKKEELQK